MPIEVLRTPLADQQVKTLHRERQKRVIEFVRDLEARGCAALSYRLTGDSPLDHLCDKHLGGRLRAIVAFESRSKAWLLLIADHDDRDPILNVYAQLYRLVGLEPEPSEKRTKPPCCDDGGVAPELGAHAEEIAARAIELRKTRKPPRNSHQRRRHPS